MEAGEARPVFSNVTQRASLYPEEAPGEDRITAQIDFIPPATLEHQAGANSVQEIWKKIRF